eukprot:TRINITY_DN8951_c0_g1_i1.p1 TRINITY_DN8951_c0_g1~~TRINITY_DN8951_c0_g1_i1.p1  ORF type:complete len:217 (-),score=40.14 TRINITY_DN8951_c0_g1_i1:64-663(-)
MEEKYKEGFQFTGEGWELMFSGDGFQAWRKTKEGTALYQYRALGTIPIPPASYFKFYTDLDHWKTWDENVELLEVFDKKEDHDFVYWSVKFPFPFSNRDYVYRRNARSIEAEGTWVVHCVAEAHPSKPANSRVRVTSYENLIALKDDGKGNTLLFMDYFDDPQMSIPSSLMNWVTKTALPQFISRLNSTAVKYHQKLSQ